MLFLCRFLTFFIYIFLLQILASCNLYLWPLLSISSVGSWLGRTAPCSRTRTRSRSTTVTANPPRFGHTTFPHLSTYLLLAWFDSTDFLFICLFFTPYILRKRRSENDFLSPLQVQQVWEGGQWVREGKLYLINVLNLCLKYFRRQPPVWRRRSLFVRASL